MKKNVKNTIVALPALSLAAVPTLLNAQNQQWNIVYIMSDDHAQQAISCYDTRYASTPNIDRLAEEGVKFTNSFVVNSISGPSRACLLTGKYSHKNGMIDNSVTFNTSQPTFPPMLQKAGYQTALIGKWHLGGTPTQSSGFDHWEILIGQGEYYNPDFITPSGKVTEQGYATHIITQKSLDWLSHRNKEKPFCLMIHHKAPHRLWAAEEKYLSLFEDSIFNVPPTFWDNYESKNGNPPRVAAKEQEMHINDLRIREDIKIDYVDRRMNQSQLAAWNAVYQPISDYFRRANLSGKALTEYKYQRYMRDYLKTSQSVDDAVGEVYAYLKKEGLLENTIIIYTSDQGFYLGEHGWFDKRFMYEESFRTPLVMRLPSQFKKKGNVTQFVQNIDHAPTFLAMAGIAKPQDIDGESYLPIIKDNNTKNWRTSMYYHYFEYPAEHAVKRHYGIRNHRYKLIHFYNDIDTWEFYDLQEDPHEMNNAINEKQYQNTIASMRQELTQMQKKYQDDKR